MYIYKTCLENIEVAAFRVAISQFALFLTLSVVLSYCSTVSTVKENSENIFALTYEKYVILGSAIYMFLPFALSCILILGLLHKHLVCLKVWLQTSFILLTILFLIELASGIYISIKGTTYIGGIIILGTALFLVYMAYSLFIINEVHKKFVQDDVCSNDPDRNDLGF